MKNYKWKKYIATLLATTLLTFPTIHAFANDPTAGNLSGFDGQVVDSKAVGEPNKAGKGKHVITLITGDVVTVSYIEGGKNVITVEPADDANGGTSIMTLGKDTYVIPDEAMTYVASEFLDKELFNITALIADGYDDEKQTTLPVIVQYAPTKARFENALPKTLTGSERTHVLESIDGVAVSTHKEQAKVFWEDLTENAITDTQSTGTIKKVWLDGRVEVNIAESVPQVGAPEAWESGFDGDDIVVAVLDTGVDPEHPDLVNQIDQSVSFVPGEDTLDYHGHGTHVASTVLGTGDASDGLHKGVAPGASLIVGKVLSSTGYGQDSWVIDGMEWAAQNAKVVNMSLGDPQPSDGTDPMSQAVNELSEETGALFVIASGNSGMEGIGSPGAADAALTVGSVDKSDRLSGFSTRGPRFMNTGLKPDLVAPGSDIIAARSQFTNQGSGLYLGLSGTSMASPHVAGAAAILSQRYPEWTGEQLKNALMSTTKKLELKPYAGGTGRLDVAAAVSSNIYATGSLDFGFFDWPHEEDMPVEKTVSYTNASDQSVTLDLSATFTDNAGSKAPEGFLQLSENQVIVPANGSAQVTVTVDPKLATLGNRYQGHLSADVDGQTVAHTVMAMGKEEERFTLTIKATDRNGNPGEATVSIMSPNQPPEFINIYGKTELRLSPDVYSVMAFMTLDENTDHTGVAILGNPEVKLDGPKTIELDAREANEITANVPDKTQAQFRKLEYYRSFSEISSVNGTYVIPATMDNIYAAPTATVNNGKFEINTRWRLVKPLMSVSHNGVELDSLAQPGSTFFEGEHQLTAVYAGRGTAKEYSNLDVKGKAVIVDRIDVFSGPQRAAAAYAAGAKLLITVNNGSTELSEWVGNEDYNTKGPIAAVSVSKAEGKELIKAAKSGGLMLNVEGTPNTPYVYDLIDDHQGAIPQDLTYSPTTDELVKINAQYNSDRPALGGEFRWDIPAYKESGIGYQFEMSYPTVRTEWVSAPEGNTIWYHQASIFEEVEVRQPVAVYQPGQRLDEEWFAPVIRPSFGEGFWTPERFENDMHFNVPSLADSGIGNAGSNLSDYRLQSLKLYQGDELVQQTQGELLLIDEVPAEKTKYRLVNDFTRDESRWNTSVSTHTEWTIWSELQNEFHTYLPMISLNYDVDTDMKGNAVTSDTITLGLTASQLSYASGNGVIEGASLEVSLDEGKQWEKVELVPNGKGWTANIANTAESGAFVSLRASAWDDIGNRIDQEIIKAFGLAESLVNLSADKKDYSLAAGTTGQMKVTETTTPEEGGEPTTIDVTNDAKYVVEDEQVASVTSGLITAKEKGSTKVTISYGGNEVTVNVTVTEAVEPVVTLTVDQTELDLETGKTAQLAVTETTTPVEGEPVVKDVTADATYAVADETIATVTDGLVKAVSKGSTTITISYGELEENVHVTVTDPELAEPVITLVADKTNIELRPSSEEEITIKEVTTTADGVVTEKDVTEHATFTIAHNNVASIKLNKGNNKGKAIVKGKGPGTTTISVKYGGKEITIEVTVVNPGKPNK